MPQGLTDLAHRLDLPQSLIVSPRNPPDWRALRRAAHVILACTPATLTGKIWGLCLLSGQFRPFLWNGSWQRLHLARLAAGLTAQKVLHPLTGRGPDHGFARLVRILRRLPGLRGLWRRGISPQIWAESANDQDWDPLFAALVAEAANQPVNPGRSGTVLHVNDGLANGGAERQILHLLPQLQAHGTPLFVGRCLDRAPGLDFHRAELQAHGIAIEPLPRPGHLGRRVWREPAPLADLLARLPAPLIADILDLGDHIRRTRPQVIQAWQDANIVPAALAGLALGVPVLVLSARNLDPTSFDYHQPWMRAAWRTLAASRAVLVNNSQAGIDAYAAWLDLPADRFRLIPNQHPLPAALPPLRPGPGRVLGGAFRFSREKRPFLWLESAALLARTHPELKFILAGDGPLLPQARALARRLALPVTFLGACRRMEDFYATIDALLLTSSHEGSPNVLLEAQAHGRPILTLAAGGAARCAGPGGIVLPVESDAAAIAAGLPIVLQEDFRLQAWEQGPAFIRRHFAPQAALSAHLDAYGWK